ncbi:MAG TPA: apolipoprotein N-acyltransferase [Acidobacteriaceae bacterium]|nr:apolipoprotein N-acyltransferase [Acidobacteriaceae bacterium]
MDRRALLFPIALGLISAVLLDFCFPVAGPMPRWHAFIAWIALVPLLYALLHSRAAAHPCYLRRAALIAWLSGVLWYALNCYWVYQTMLYYAHVPPLGSAGILVLYSAILGLYFGLFGLLLALFRRRFSLTAALLLAPFLWTALELAASRVTSVPWDQLGYSQIDSHGLITLAPVTGVYGISFAVVLANAFLVSFALSRVATRRWRLRVLILVFAFVLIWANLNPTSKSAPTSTYAVLLQPNIQVAADAGWSGDEWHGNLSWLLTQDAQTCTPAYAGLPGPSAISQTTPPECAQNTPPPGVILWPETASWFQSDQPHTLDAMHTLATTAHAPVIAGMAGPDGDYNSALFVRADGSVAGRYDKIHLVPFGEYIPYRRAFFFAKTLTHQLVDLQRGTQRNVFPTGGPDGHTFGVFICYESIFADEIRHFALHGAQVLVNLSDDGWYGDTSAPWQHLNMSRMRAVENRRWLLLDTNNGVTTVIDPYGRVTLSAPRHTLTSLVARYGYRSDLTFYTRYGDVFAYLCCAVVLAALAAAIKRPPATR